MRSEFEALGRLDDREDGPTSEYHEGVADLLPPRSSFSIGAYAVFFAFSPLLLSSCPAPKPLYLLTAYHLASTFGL